MADYKLNIIEVRCGSAPLLNSRAAVNAIFIYKFINNMIESRNYIN